jgi:hypothetical protein
MKSNVMIQRNCQRMVKSQKNKFFHIALQRDVSEAQLTLKKLLKLLPKRWQSFKMLLSPDSKTRMEYCRWF